ncbi:MAG: hypothetical protein ABIQ93_06910 [Saprospiraceae bacterium]
MKTVLKIACCGIAVAALCLLAAFGRHDEEAAIKAVIEKETASFFSGDLAAWASCYKQDAHTLVISASLDGPTVTQGWEAVRKDAEEMHKGSPGPWKYQIERSNWRIQQSGNTAFALYDETLTFTDWPGTHYNKEIRCLEKVGGAWKIVALSWTEKISLNTEEQQAKIKAVIDAETQAFTDQNYAHWAETWLQDESATLTWNNEDGSVGQTIGFEKVAAGAKEDLKKSQNKSGLARLVRDNWDIHIVGSMAVVRFDQHLTDDQGKTFHSKEFRTLRWDGERWRIAQLSGFWDYKNAK